VRALSAGPVAAGGPAWAGRAGFGGWFPWALFSFRCSFGGVLWLLLLSLSLVPSVWSRRAVSLCRGLRRVRRSARLGGAWWLVPPFAVARVAGAWRPPRARSPGLCSASLSPALAARLRSRRSGVAGAGFPSPSLLAALPGFVSGWRSSPCLARPPRLRRRRAPGWVARGFSRFLASPRRVCPVFSCPPPLPVALVGSRSLPAAGVALVARVVRALARAGRPLCVGCAVGADAAALSAAVAAGCAPSVSVFAVGGSSGSGFCSLSALAGVRVAAAAGASVAWWSGGPASVPLAARLACRSRACVAAAPGGVVAFLSSPASAGSLAAVSLAAASGLSVCVFCLGFSPSLLPQLGGSWVPAAAAGLWSAAVRFVPPPSLF
jgi:hypothetical protein